MKKTVWVYLGFLVLGLFVLSFAKGRVTHEKQVVSFPIVTTGDVAAVLKFTPGAAVDSFAYLCTLVVNTADSAAIAWRSHPQRQRLTPSTVWDEARTIALKFNFINETLTVATLDPAVTYTTGAKIVDTLTYIINNTTNLKDSILAVDSGTYVKLIDKKNGVRAKRWSIQITLAGGATSALDTLTNAQRITAGYITTAAMICDSMVAKINANAICSPYLTAYDSTTFWIIKSDDPGLEIEADIPNIDTTADTTRTTANVAGRSRFTDTIPLIPVLTEAVGPRVKGIRYTIIMDSLPDMLGQGMGLSDSSYLQIWAGYLQGGNWKYTAVSKDSAALLPNTLFYAMPTSTAGTDTLFGEQLFLQVRIADTASDTTCTLPIPLYIDAEIFYDD